MAKHSDDNDVIFEARDLKINAVRDSGRNFGLVMVAEAARMPDGEVIGRARDDGGIRLGGIGHAVGELIEERTGSETRVTVLGHVQRGACPARAIVCSLRLLVSRRWIWSPRTSLTGWSYGPAATVPTSP